MNTDTWKHWAFLAISIRVYLCPSVVSSCSPKTK